MDDEEEEKEGDENTFDFLKKNDVFSKSNSKEYNSNKSYRNISDD